MSIGNPRCELLWLKTTLTDRMALKTALYTLFTREFDRENVRGHQRQQFICGITPKGHFPADYLAHYSIAEGCKPENQVFNRYLDVQPYNRTRVILGDWKDDAEKGETARQRYLSANWVRELFGGKWWVATQAPLPTTMHAFLSMLFQPLSHLPASFHSLSSSRPTKRIRIRTVVQLTDGNTRMGHHAYLPLDVGESLTMAPERNCDAPSLKVTLLERQTINEAQCIQSTVSILPISSSTSDQEEPEPVVFRHLLYSSWPDHGVPESREHFIRFLHLVDRVNKDVSLATSDAELDPDSPIMIHCSAGVGRTGTLLAAMSLLRAYDHLTETPSPMTHPVTALPGLAPSPLGPLPESVQKDMVVNEVDSMREQRPGMVQKDQQILYIYEVFALGLGFVRTGVTSE